MAARTRKGTAAIGWPVEVRQRIRTSMLINRLTAHALGEADPQTGKPVDLSPTQVRSIEILLKKSLPDLTATEITSVETRGLDDMSTEEILAMLQRCEAAGIEDELVN